MENAVVVIRMILPLARLYLADLALQQIGSSQACLQKLHHKLKRRLE